MVMCTMYVTVFSRFSLELIAQRNRVIIAEDAHTTNVARRDQKEINLYYYISLRIVGSKNIALYHC